MSIEIQAKNNTAVIDTQLLKESAGVPNKEAKEVRRTDQESKLAEISINSPDSVKPVELSKEQIAEAVNKLQDYADQYKRELRFSIDEETGRTIVRLLDSEDRVLRQIPSEDVLSLAQSLKDNIGGLFEDQV